MQDNKSQAGPWDKLCQGYSTKQEPRDNTFDMTTISSTMHTRPRKRSRQLLLPCRNMQTRPRTQAGSHRHDLEQTKPSKPGTSRRNGRQSTTEEAETSTTYTSKSGACATKPHWGVSPVFPLRKNKALQCKLRGRKPSEVACCAPLARTKS